MENTLKTKARNSEFYKVLGRLALPIIIQNFITAFLNMIDTVMVGKLGEVEIASVGVANQYFFFFNLLVLGISSGGGIFISQFWGKRDKKNIRKILGVNVIAGVSISLIMTLIALLMPENIISLFNKDPQVIQSGAKYLKVISVSYILTAITLAYSISLRCIGEAIIPMAISGIALITNVFFNYGLIFGHFGLPALGVKGAALATVIARLVECVALLIYVYSKKGVLAASIKEMTDINMKFINKIYRTIASVLFNEACWGLAMVMYAAIYGRIGTKAIASIQICTTVQNLFMVVTLGVANASAVMIGNKIGEGKEEEGKEYAKKFTKMGIVLGIILGFSMALSAPFILNLFNVSKEVMTTSLLILYITSAIMVMRVFNAVMIVGVLRGGGDAKYALISEAVTMWLVGLPLTLIAAFIIKLPVYIVASMAGIEEFGKFILSYKRVKSNKWIKNVIHNI
ncbi:MATE family efflux transporter [Clostridium cochlearium]|uniref:MATE family efflux transporter n=1 Tax=Clostridium cochlearium TaxID=1494 RepID=UPI0022E00618|nr:MATE family efflux transporter [Clostridium cochlearium]